VDGDYIEFTDIDHRANHLSVLVQLLNPTAVAGASGTFPILVMADNTECLSMNSAMASLGWRSPTPPGTPASGAQPPHGSTPSSPGKPGGPCAGRPPTNQTSSPARTHQGADRTDEEEAAVDVAEDPAKHHHSRK
jgi:hypothetical protein